MRNRRRRTSPSQGRTFGALVAVLVVLVGAGCTPPADTEATPTQQLDQLLVVDRPSRTPDYRRSAFGTAWADTDHDGCSQRRDALAATVDRTRAFTERRRGACAHDVVAGTWTDPYTGQALTLTDLTDPHQAQQIPIDHVVALALAYRYGARSWTAERRLAFATDLSNLQPTSRATNVSKSDHDPAAWKPRAPYQCAYATRYVAVKSRYQLPVDAAEKKALRAMLATCPG